MRSKEFSFECSSIFLENLNVVKVVPYHSQQDFLDNIRQIHRKKVFICVDINIDFLSDDTRKERTQSLLNTYNMDYVINKPTRITAYSKRAIDNIFANIQNNITHDIVDGLSDHTCQVILQ